MAKFVPENWGLSQLTPDQIRDETLEKYVAASIMKAPGADPLDPDQWDDVRVRLQDLVATQGQLNNLAISEPLFTGSWTDLVGMDITITGRKFTWVIFGVVFEATKAGMDNQFTGQVRVSVDGTPIDETVFPLSLYTDSVAYDFRSFIYPWFPPLGTETISLEATSLLGDGTARILGADVMGANGSTFLEVIQ